MEAIDQEILELGFMLEAKGLSHSQIDRFFEHHGVKGQKWGVIRKRAQNTLANKPQGPNDNFTRSGRTTRSTMGKTQTRTARNVKRGAAFIAGNIPGLILYNAVSKPVNGKKPPKTQSGAAYAAKLVATGVLLTPLSAIAYHQMAAPVRIHDKATSTAAGKKSSKAKKKNPQAKEIAQVEAFLKKNPNPPS